MNLKNVFFVLLFCATSLNFQNMYTDITPCFFVLTPPKIRRLADVG